MRAYRERDFEFEATNVHAIEGGAGFPLLLLHGSGPGASTIGNWRLVLEPLAEQYQIFAMDLIGFGRSGRRAHPPFFDVGFWLDQARALIKRMPAGPFGIVGHSLSAALALKLAAAEPRVAAVLTTGAMGADFPVNAGTRLCWTFPETREDLQAVAEVLIHDRRHITADYLDNRVKTLFGDDDYRAYFSAMFAGEQQRFVSEALLTPDELAAITVPVTMLHGRDDSAFPPAITLRLAEQLPQADVVLLGNCAHSIALEHPQKLLAACFALFPA